MFFNYGIDELYRDIKKLLSNSETGLIEEAYKDSYIRVREYLASALTEQILNKSLNDKVKIELNNKIAFYDQIPGDKMKE